MQISTDFPGGNAIIKNLGVNEFSIEPDQRDTTLEWFYWCFKLKNLDGNEAILHLKKGCMTSKGYALSYDDGLTWQWADLKTIKENTIRLTVPHQASEVLLSLSMTYTYKNWELFLQKNSLNSTKYLEVLTETRDKRKSPLLRIKGNEKPANKIIITARHHSCEMMASYVIEGFVEAVLQFQNKSAFTNTEFVFIPFVDLDGVEKGDQGKARAPYDHNRDYGDSHLYPETPAIKNEVNRNLKQNVFTLDLHCPALKGLWNEQVYMVGSSSDKIFKTQTKFLTSVKIENDGAIPFGPKNILPFGQEWNTSNLNIHNRTWCALQPQVKLAMSMEVPYGNAEGNEVNQSSASQLGHVICRALVNFANSF